MLAAFSGLHQLERLVQAEQDECLRQYRLQLNTHILPTLLQFAVLVNFVISLLFVSAIILASGWQKDAKLGLLYLLIVSCFYVLIRFSRLGKATLANVYGFSLILICWAFYMYVFNGGDLIHLRAGPLTLAFVGWFTLSIRHTLLIWTLYLFSGWLAVCVLHGFSGSPEYWIEATLTWFLAVCLAISISSAWFGNLLIKNLFVLQFLLTRRNGQLEEALTNLAKQEQLLARRQKHQALNHLAAGLLHEIINPVNNTIQALNYAQCLTADAASLEPINDALSNQYRIEGIIRDLRSYTSEKPNSPKVQVPIFELINKTLGICKSELQSVELDLEGSRTELVWCYPGELLQVCVNLVLNAAAALHDKYAGRGGKLVIAWRTDGDRCEIRFQDNGVGIAADVLATVSDPFVGNEQGEHLGLGLSICQTIVKHHGGELSINSRLGQQTEVAVLLPLQAL